MQKTTNQFQLKKLWDAHWQSGVREELFITITPQGLKYGTVVLAKFGDDGMLALEGKERKVRALLAVVFDHEFPDNLIHKIRCAEHALKRDGEAMMHMHFALAGFHKLEWMWQLQHLFYADTLLNNGMGLPQMLTCFGITKFNPYHVPAGSPEGGQFTTAAGAGAVADALDLDINNLPGIETASAVLDGILEVAADILDSLIPDGDWIREEGNREGIQVVFNYRGETGLTAAQKMFSELTEGQGGLEVTPKNYGGRMFKLPSGDLVGIREISRSGIPTLDIRLAGSKKPLKLKFP